MKSKRVSFINISFVATALILLTAFFGAFSVLACLLDAPWYMQVFCILITLFIFVTTFFIFFNGLYIRKSGDIVFVPDYRIKKIKISDVDRIAINFREQDNGKYSASLKVVYKDRRTFSKDYADQFNIYRHKKFVMSGYTIKKTKVDKVCNMLSDIDVFILTVINKSGAVQIRRNKK